MALVGYMYMCVGACQHITVIIKEEHMDLRVSGKGHMS